MKIVKSNSSWQWAGYASLAISRIACGQTVQFGFSQTLSDAYWDLVIVVRGKNADMEIFGSLPSVARPTLGVYIMLSVISSIWRDLEWEVCATADEPRGGSLWGNTGVEMG